MSALPTLAELAVSPVCADIAAVWPTAEVIRVIDDLDGLDAPNDPNDVDDLDDPVLPAQPTDVRDLSIHLSYFSVGKPKGPAFGDSRDTTWGRFCDALRKRRQGDKDGPNFIPARFTLEPDGKQVRRLKANVLARTAIVLDIETNARTGEVPVSFDAAVEFVRGEGWAGVVYTSHNHTTEAPRYRIVLPLSLEIDPELPAVEAVADELWLSSVMDLSKRGASSLFYMPSCDPGKLDGHRVEIIDGDPIDAGWIRTIAGEMLAEQTATDAHSAAEKRRQATIAAAGDGLIEKIRPRLDLKQTLLSHGYKQQGTKFRHPNSKSGSFGADIQTFGGIERVYSHNAGDPLHRDNLPEWCDGVTALDAFDVAAILDFGGDRKKAMAELAKRFGITRANERRAVARLIHRMRDAGACQEAIEAAAFVEGEHLGLSKEEVISVAKSVASKIAGRAR
jgi:hypothetical protein